MIHSLSSNLLSEIYRTPNETDRSFVNGFQVQINASTETQISERCDRANICCVAISVVRQIGVGSRIGVFGMVVIVTVGDG